MTASARHSHGGSPAQATYRCVACGSRWRYEQVRTIARCRACGCGLAICGEPPRAAPPKP
jgi:DNA-directed RNA polymerase subunit RPC12/RpoP